MHIVAGLIVIAVALLFVYAALDRQSIQSNCVIVQLSSLGTENGTFCFFESNLTLAGRAILTRNFAGMFEFL